MANFDNYPNHLVREHFREDGLPKTPRRQAEAIEYAMENELVAYACTFCEYWHVATSDD